MDVNIFKCMLNINDMRFESLSCPQNISDSLGKAVAKENKLTLNSRFIHYAVPTLMVDVYSHIRERHVELH